ncbi:hypothetical protein BDA99DRAFT_537163 [Phascolomyces articulosus]|uniref:Uncharacterized protein n=1 Tax=Phascolomyces articulosus TaxID=60185 RepID=A0AAD5K9T3_9FUNG|nr:hypothetical protein BDA99DRAFT_537163 [Phascolomyces articulosus]
MHNSGTKVKIQSTDDFYNALGNIKEASDQLAKDSFKNENSDVEHLVRERMDSFIREIAVIASSHVHVPNGESIDLKEFDVEPFDTRLADEALELERQTRVALENVIEQRKGTLAQLEPLAKEIISNQASVGRTGYEDNNKDDTNNNDDQQQKQDQPVDFTTMLKEYQDTMRIFPQLEKTLVEATMDVKQSNSICKNGKLL